MVGSNMKKIILWEPPLKEYDRLSQSVKTKEFEEKFAEHAGSKFAVATSSGTASLFMGLKAVGVGIGDKVVVPDLTFVATANAVRLTGAEVVLADVSREDLLIKAVHGELSFLAVHLNGRVVKDLNHLKVSGLQVVEDACQALGSKGVGEGDVACYSFSPTKSIYTGQGGAVTTDDYWIYQKLLMLRDHGRLKTGSQALSVTEGYNFKYTDLQAEIALKYIEKLDWIYEEKKRVYRTYKWHLSDHPSISFIETDLDITVPWLVDILFKDYHTRERLINHLERNGIETRRFYTPLHIHPIYRQNGFPNSSYVSQRGLYLPSSIHLTEDHITHICNKITEFFR